MSLESKNFLTACSIPEYGCFVRASGQDTFSIRRSTLSSLHWYGPRRVRISFPFAASQIFAVLSQLPVNMRLPSGEKQTELTVLVWLLRFGFPFRERIPDLRRFVKTACQDMLAIWRETRRVHITVCSLKVRTSFRVTGSQILAFSPISCQKTLPSGEKPTEVTY